MRSKISDDSMARFYNIKTTIGIVFHCLMTTEIAFLMTPKLRYDYRICSPYICDNFWPDYVYVYFSFLSRFSRYSNFGSHHEGFSDIARSTQVRKSSPFGRMIDNCQMCSAKKFVLNFDQQNCFAPLYDSFTWFCYVRHTISKKHARNYSMKEVLREARSSWLLLLQVERIRLYEAELKVFLIRRTNTIFVWRKQLFC